MHSRVRARLVLAASEGAELHTMRSTASPSHSCLAFAGREGRPSQRATRGLRNTTPMYTPPSRYAFTCASTLSVRERLCSTRYARDGKITQRTQHTKNVRSASVASFKEPRYPRPSPRRRTVHDT